jgi:hypothetical protein
MALKPISTAYFINPPIRLCVYPFVARQRLGKNITAATNTHVTIKELSDGSFTKRSVLYEGKWAISSSQNFLFSVNALMLGSTNEFCLFFAPTL